MRTNIDARDAFEYISCAMNISILIHTFFDIMFFLDFLFGLFSPYMITIIMSVLTSVVMPTQA